MMEFVDTYSKIKEGKPFSGRQYLRNVALNTLSWIDRRSGAESYLVRPRVQFLYVHHIFKDEEVAFERLINVLSKNHHFISYAKAVEFILNRKIDRPYLVISSDDGFKNNLRAAEILNKYDIKGCFFINPSVIDGLDDRKLIDYCRQKLHFPPVEFLNWRDVEQLQNWGHEIGSHSMNHYNLAVLANDQLQEELVVSYHILKERCGRPLHFAYPYGRFFHFNEDARKIVFNTGYHSCASAERGCHVNPIIKMKNDELCILRDHILLDWPLNHVYYFIAKNARNSKPENNYFSY